jgi:hypothetical protein
MVSTIPKLAERLSKYVYRTDRAFSDRDANEINEQQRRE